MATHGLIWTSIPHQSPLYRVQKPSANSIQRHKSIFSLTNRSGMKAIGAQNAKPVKIGCLFSVILANAKASPKQAASSNQYQAWATSMNGIRAMGDSRTANWGG